MNDVKTSSSSLKLSWFEFLLNPSLLEKHLNHENLDPVPTELIISFLSNCSSPTSETNNNGNKSNQPPVLPADDSNLEAPEIKLPNEGPESKKSQALKFLALKVAAFLKWDVSLFEKKLPLTMQQILLKELLKVTGSEVKRNGEVKKNGSDSNPNAEFARILYYTWVLRAVVEGSYPSKGQKTINMQIPGQVDPSAVPPAVIETIMRKLHEETETAATALEEWVQAPSKVQMPLLSCFGSITDECLDPVHNWEQGHLLKEEEIICQVSYALGRFYFFQEDYEVASKHFNRASDLFPKFQNPVFCHVNECKLKGFYNACAHLLGYQKSDSSTPLKESLQMSVKAAHQDTIQILRNDNTKRELSLAIRDSVEMNVLQEHYSEVDLVLYTTFCNVLRRTVDAHVVLSDWLTLLKSNEEKSSIILCELLKELIPSCSQQQKLFLKNFIRMVCLNSVPAKVLFKKFEVLNLLLCSKEVEDLFAFGQSTLSKKETLKLDKSFTDDSSVQVGLLERRLLSTGDAATIKRTVAQLRGNYGLRNICSLNRKWEMPRAVFIFLKGVPPHVDQEMIQMLLAKSSELCAIKNYGDARHLLRNIENEIRNFSPRLSRYLSSELLKLDLLEILDAPVYTCQPAPYRTEVVQRILSFLSCFKDREFPPDSNLLEFCASVMLNFREWDKIIDIGTGLGPFFEYSRAVSAVCKEIFLNKAGRNSTRELWDITLPIFTNAHVNPHKRSASGTIKDLPREYAHAIIHRFALQLFIRKLKDTSCLGVIISCLAKFYNILKDDSMGEIFLEYQGLWPTTVSNAALFNTSAVSEAFQATLQHALSVHPTHSAWLRTKGDVMYVQGHYSAALKFYLSAAMVSTDYFYLLLPKVLFDDLMFKHMIHCCTKLHNHTQSAILHQFLDESNYPMAFKALSERVCNDGCDAYYPCIWDVTLLEYLINLHSRRGDLDYHHLVMHLIGQLELNSNNNEEIQREAANLRKGRFLRAMAKQFL